MVCARKGEAHQRTNHVAGCTAGCFDRAAGGAVTGDDVADLARELLRRPFATAVVGPYAHPDDLPAELQG